MNVIVTHGNIENGKLTLDNRQGFERDYLKITGRVDIMISPATNRRTNPQNRYYWGVVMKIMKAYYDEYGNTYTQQEIHELLKSQCGLTQTIIHPTTGEAIQITRSLSNLGDICTVGFNDYIDKIRAAYPEIYIPAPNEKF